MSDDLQTLIEEFFAREFRTDNPVITEAVRRMLAAGGKRLRPRLLLLSAEAAGSEAGDHLALAAYMELIHVATLIHDDVVDRADTRRGVNATAVDFGNRISVLAGDYLFAWIFRAVTADYPHPIPHVLSATLASICDGEVLQLRALGNLRLSFDQYVAIIERKTASLFAASAECGALVGHASPELISALRAFGQAYGIAFQMRDDLLDVTASSQELGKPAGNDLRERKITMPIIAALESGDANLRDRLQRFYRSDGTVDERDLGGILAAMSRAGAPQRTREAIAQYVESAKRSLAPIESSPARGRLAELADDLMQPL
ncbi:MAG: polyprenyl synthetase family protein [Candidatus Eremiobacteraeota bacterium]|nr:polyprenyl synthetase family protein [Candidatus Eremiobacteraeota bacterium]